MTAYYNEIDPFAAEWLRQLIKKGLIADGIVDERSIVDVESEDLGEFTQCHFFAGIGGWSRALRLASWPDSRPVWTGSPPCQPFSNAGKQLGVFDERHLTPAWLDLIRARKPIVIFGEQVAAAVKKDFWLDDLQDALEREGYATGEIILPACGIGAPHLRQRLWIIAKRMGYTDLPRTAIRLSEPPKWEKGQSEVYDDRGDRLFQSRSGRSGAISMGDAHSEHARRHSGASIKAQRRGGLRPIGNGSGPSGATCEGSSTAGPLYGSWAASDWLYCRDGKWRPVESGSFPLANGLSGRVGPLRGYGNAIVPELAAEVIGAAMELFSDET
jgi:DNA (cytosine-5)-methyltransferase 1